MVVMMSSTSDQLVKDKQLCKSPDPAHVYLKSLLKQNYCVLLDKYLMN